MDGIIGYIIGYLFFSVVPESVKLSKQQSAAPAPKMHQPRHCFC